MSFRYAHALETAVLLSVSFSVIIYKDFCDFLFSEVIFEKISRWMLFSIYVIVYLKNVTIKHQYYYSFGNYQLNYHNFADFCSISTANSNASLLFYVHVFSLTVAVIYFCCDCFEQLILQPY